MTKEKVIERIEWTRCFKEVEPTENGDIKVYAYGENLIQIWQLFDTYGISVINKVNDKRVGYYYNFLDEVNDMEISVDDDKLTIRISAKTILYFYK